MFTRDLLFILLEADCRVGDLFCSSLIMCQKNLTSIPPQPQSIETEARGESGVEQSGVQRTGCLCEESSDSWNYNVTNPFFSAESSECNNPRKTPQPVVGTTRALGKFGGWRRLESGGITFGLQFDFVDTSGGCESSMSRWRVYSTSDHRNAATSSSKYTEQVAPPFLRFEACNSLESLLLHCSNVDFN